MRRAAPRAHAAVDACARLVGVRCNSQPRSSRFTCAAAADGVPSRPSGSRGGSNDPPEAVAAALANANKAATEAENALERVPMLPSARRQNYALQKAIKIFRRTFAIVAVLGATAHLLLCQPAAPQIRFFAADLITTMLCVGGYIKRSLSESGAITAAFVGVGTIFSSYAFGGILLAFFVSCSLLSRLAGGSKKRIDAEYKEDGQRNWGQVLCNGAVPTVLALLYAYSIGWGHVPFLHGGVAWQATALQAAVMGYYACACGDTWASEVGVLSPGPARLILTGRRVRKGTNGAVSNLGLAFSAAGGLLIGLVGWLFAVIGHGSTELPAHAAGIILLGVFGGFAGSCIDSITGSILQFSGYDHKLDKMVSKPGLNVHKICGNDLITNSQNNLLANCLTSALCAAVAVKFFCA